MSFTDWDGLSPTSNFIWFENYIDMFHNPDLWQSLRNNAVYFFAHLLMIPVELAFAVLLNSKLRGAKFTRPWSLCPISSTAWPFPMPSPISSPPSTARSTPSWKRSSWGMLSQSWLSDPKIVNFVLAFVSLWRYSGYHIVLFLAALQSVSRDIQEAAIIDGANTWQMFRYIQIPSIMLMVDFVLFDNIRGALQVFDIPFVMTSGGRATPPAPSPSTPSRPPSPSPTSAWPPPWRWPSWS